MPDEDPAYKASELTNIGNEQQAQGAKLEEIRDKVVTYLDLVLSAI